MKRRTSDSTFIDSTVDVVAEIGIENLRTKMIADNSGFSEATLFRYYANKDELLCGTFLELDKRIAEIILAGIRDENFDIIPMEYAAYNIWKKFYRYLIEHRKETLYIIRFRYSSMYTEKVREKTRLYNGTFNDAFEVLMERCGKRTHDYFTFLLSNMYEITLCFAEKVLIGEIGNTSEHEKNAWLATSAVAGNMIKAADKANAYAV